MARSERAVGVDQRAAQMAAAHRRQALDPHVGQGEHRLRDCPGRTAPARWKSRRRAAAPAEPGVTRASISSASSASAAGASRRPGARRGRRGTPARREGRIVRPAAMAWPPPASSRPSSNAAWIARPRLTPGCERPEPLPMSATRIEADHHHRAAIALAQAARRRCRSRPDASPRRATTMAGAVGSKLASDSMAATAASRICALDRPCAAAFSASSSSASALASSRIVGGQQPRAQVRAADAAAGVDPRAEDEAGVEDAGRALGAGDLASAP